MPSFPSMGTTTELAATACHPPARCRSLNAAARTLAVGPAARCYSPVLRHMPACRPRTQGPAGCSPSLLRRALVAPCVPPFCTSTQPFGRKVQVAGTSQTRWRTGERTDEDRREKTTGRIKHIDRADWLDLRGLHQQILRCVL
ncbi:hypothetical protein GQ55_1G175400 [Panicum hallii var. hallii]|uniref:Uncharacterized protein n=1 Tax=Panicum hallii var. hallii TaxID=1504633 RepID=A0A2T7F5Y6_9POAL|nr:hypothetical protein GQ55_1G175400 [Panicum hallii var. hallii]